MVPRQRKCYRTSMEWLSPSKVIRENSPSGKRMRRSNKPRRSLGLCSPSDWEHCQDGFDGLDVNTRKPNSHRSKKTPNQHNVTHTERAEGNTDGFRLSQVDIDNFSSEGEDNFDDITPLDPLDSSPSNAGTMCLPGLHLNHPKSSSKKDSGRNTSLYLKEYKKRKRMIHNPKDKYRDDANEGIDIDVESPEQKRHQWHSPRHQAGSPSQTFHAQSEDCKQLEADEETDSPVILTASTASSSDQDLATSKQRGTDWLKNLQWQAPSPETLSNMEDEPTTYEDSSKKKKQKFIRGGLAESLRSLVSREKSDVAFWTHKVNSNAAHTTEVESLRSRTVQIRNVTSQYLMMIASCSIIDENKTDNTRHKEDEQITVLFNRQTVEQLGVQEGSVVRIHAPWQTLQLSCGKKVMLCTHFCRLVSSNASEARDTCDEVKGSQDQKMTCSQVLASWNCPCVKGVPKVSCPAQSFPSCTAPPPDGAVCHTSPCAAEEGVSREDAEAALQTVWYSQLPRQVSNSILESIEQQDGFSSSGISFKATLQRVFCQQLNPTPHTSEPVAKAWRRRATSDGVQQHSLLVQDDQGALCQILLETHAEHTDEWRHLVAEGEGRLWAFTCMRQHQRTKRSRSPGLFQLIDSVWSPQSVLITASSSQESSEKCEDLEACLQPPGFCYQFVATAGSSRCHDLQATSSTYRPPSCYPLQELHSMEGIAQRVTIKCKLIYYCTERLTTLFGGQRHWYITDSSLQVAPRGGHGKGYIHVVVGSTCYVSPEVNDVITQGAAVLVLKDINTATGIFTLDGYSRVSLATQTSCGKYRVGAESVDLDLETLTPMFPSLLDSVDNLKEMELIALEGTVCGVNEETAYSWIVCEKCGGDKLKEDGSGYQCEDCRQFLQQPLTKMTLEVYVHCDLNPSGSRGTQAEVKVKLLQETIECLLPDEEDGEGYELEGILGRRIGSLVCRIVEVSRGTENKLQKLQLEEICIQSRTPILI